MNEPVKVLMTADTVGGVWTYALDLVRALEPHGVTVALATMGAGLSAAQRETADSLENLTLFESGYKLEWMASPWDDVDAAGAWLLELERQFRPDLVHLNGYAHAALPWSSPTLVVGHSCVLSWWTAVKGEPVPSDWRRYADAVRGGLAAADVVVAPTRAMLDALETHYGPLPRSRVVPNGRDSALFALREKEPFIMAAGRLWDEAKNLAMLAEVAPALEWPVYLAGDATHPDGSEVRFENVKVLGHLPSKALAACLGRASIYALPARYEPFGLSVLEAALSGCALVLGDIPSLREVWGDAALFVAPDDREGWQRTLSRLIRRPDLRDEFARQARVRALQYTPERMAAGYLQVYSSLADRTRSFALA